MLRELKAKISLLKTKDLVDLQTESAKGRYLGKHPLALGRGNGSRLSLL